MAPRSKTGGKGGGAKAGGKSGGAKDGGKGKKRGGGGGFSGGSGGKQEEWGYAAGDWGAQPPWIGHGQEFMWWPGMADDSKQWPTPKAAAKKAAKDGEADEAGENVAEDQANAAANLLDALAPGGEAGAKAKGGARIQAGERAPGQTAPNHMSPDKLLGHWVDSNGNAVHVLNTDAYDVRLSATLTKPPRPDIHLSVKPVVLGAGWQCGHSLLDPVWTTAQQLHWVSMDGRVSVWVRPDTGDEDEAKPSEDKTEEKTEEKKAEGSEDAAPDAAKEEAQAESQ